MVNAIESPHGDHAVLHPATNAAAISVATSDLEYRATTAVPIAKTTITCGSMR